MESDRVCCYTDGACSGNPGLGGWGALLVWKDREREISGGEKQTTNNRMELTGVIHALETLKRPSDVHIFTDSTYVKDGITKWIKNWRKNGWLTAKKKPVKNIDLWQRLEVATREHKVEWFWVKAHAGHPRNERADALAHQGLKKCSTD